ncbi:MAG: proton-conducting transporter membrane subunit [Acidimicrobiales bacterium]
MAVWLAGLGVALSAIAVGALAPRPQRVVLAHALTALAGVLVGAAAIAALVTGTTPHARTGALLPLAGASLRLDALGASLEVTVALVVTAAALFSIGYAHGASASRPAVALQAAFALSVLLVPAAGDAVTFLGAWEAMAATSLALLLVEHDRSGARAAALWYGAMTQAGAAAITLGLLVLVAAAHTTSFLGIAAADVRGPAAVVAFVVTVAGFASKAGAVPLHVWLPRAHPEASTPVSAMMSGAMTALGLYGIARVDLGILTAIGRWWWVGVLVVAAASALYGALHAATATDLKRLLAYSTIDAMGLGLIGLAAAGELRAGGAPRAAATLIVGALIVLGAHGAYKTLLFLAAGLVERATGTRDLDLLGGLAAAMPRTSSLVALAVASAVGVPLAAGFVGEWLEIEGLVAGLARRDPGGVAATLLGLVALALASGLTAVAMVKLLGIGFLGRPRSAGARAAREPRGIVTVALALPALATLALGILPGPAVVVADRAVGDLGGMPLRALHGGPGGIAVAASASALRPVALLAGLVGATLVLVALARAGHRRIRRTAPWACGRRELSARMQYTATSFAEPVQRVFADVLRPDVDVTLTHEDESRDIERVLAYQSSVADAVESGLYRPLVRGADALGRRARALANGSVHRYLAYGLVALLAVLVVLR